MKSSKNGKNWLGPKSGPIDLLITHARCSRTILSEQPPCNSRTATNSQVPASLITTRRRRTKHFRR